MSQLEATLAKIKALPQVEARIFDGHEADGTPQSWRRQCVPLIKVEAILREADADTAVRADDMLGCLLWLLWHHQGGSSPVGQPIRKALGIGNFDALTPAQVEHAKAFAAAPKLTP